MKPRHFQYLFAFIAEGIAHYAFGNDFGQAIDACHLPRGTTITFLWQIDSAQAEANGWKVAGTNVNKPW